MSVRIEVTVEGTAQAKQAILRLAAPQSDAIWAEALEKAAFSISDALKDGTWIVLGRAADAEPLPDKLTSRQFGRGLIGSIGVDLEGSPRFAVVGTEKEYAHVHESGGTFTIPAHTVKAHIRKIHRITKKGTKSKNRSSIQVRSHTVRAHSAKFPARPYFRPATDREAPKFPGFLEAALEKALSR